MAPTFSNTSTKVTVTATLPAQANGQRITEQDVRWALEQVARENGVQVTDLSVTLEPGERTVTMTEAEYNALRGSQA